MAAPFIDTQDVINSLADSLDPDWAIPLYSDFPSDSDIVRYGIYVSDVHQVERTPYQLGVTFGGGTYDATDQFQVVYISFQDDPHNIDVNTIISDLVSVNNPDSTTPLMDGYFERDFDQALVYGPQAERHSWTFRMHRLEFQ